MNLPLTPLYNNALFCDIWDSDADFLADYNASPLKEISADDAKIVYYLLYARHGNDPISHLDIFQWKTRLFSIMYQYGPNWVKELAIQKKLRELSDDEIQGGSFMIYNHAYNPETAPSTSAETELTYINEQNTNRYKKGIVDAYTNFELLLKKDVTNAFLNKFDSLFKIFVSPEHPMVFETEDD